MDRHTGLDPVFHANSLIHCLMSIDSQDYHYFDYGGQQFICRRYDPAEAIYVDFPVDFPFPFKKMSQPVNVDDEDDFVDADDDKRTPPQVMQEAPDDFVDDDEAEEDNAPEEDANGMLYKMTDEHFEGVKEHFGTLEEKLDILNQGNIKIDKSIKDLGNKIVRCFESLEKVIGTSDDLDRKRKLAILLDDKLAETIREKPVELKRLKKGHSHGKDDSQEK